MVKGDINMNRVGIKLWNINTENDLEKARKIYEQGFYDYIELYIVPGNLEKLKFWKSLDIPFIIHAPHFGHKMNLSKSEYESDNKVFYDEVKLYADELNADYIIFHSGTDGTIQETVRQIGQINDPRALIENKPYKTVHWINGEVHVGSKFEEIEYAAETLGCGVCLDVGHAIASANSFGIEPYSYVEKFLALDPKMIHLSDIDISSEFDCHYNFGQGNLDFTKLFEILPNDNIITVETKKVSDDNLNYFIDDIKFLRRFLKRKTETL